MLFVKFKITGLEELFYLIRLSNLEKCPEVGWLEFKFDIFDELSPFFMKFQFYKSWSKVKILIKYSGIFFPFFSISAVTTTGPRARGLGWAPWPPRLLGTLGTLAPPGYWVPWAPWPPGYLVPWAPWPPRLLGTMGALAPPVTGYHGRPGPPGYWVPWPAMGDPVSPRAKHELIQRWRANRFMFKGRLTSSPQ